MRVLYVTAGMSPSWGGPAYMIRALAPVLAKYGVETEIATAVGWRVGNAPMSVPGVPVHCFRTGLPARVWTAWSRGLSCFLAREMGRFDLVHIHEIWHYPAYVAYHAARRHGLPYLASVHANFDPPCMRYKRIRKRLYLHTVLRQMLKSVDALHALTREEVASISRLAPSSVPVHVIPNGASPHVQATPADKRAFLARYPVLAGKRVILYMSRLHAIKGLDVLARSFATVAARFPDAVLLVGGLDEDGTRGRAEAILARHRVRDRAVFAGQLTGSDKQAALDCSSLFVLSSHSEGFSMAVLEAMAAGLPVVISDQCSFPEVAECEAGFVVEVAEASVADAIGALLADADLRTRMGGNGSALVAERYAWPTIARSFADLYLDLISKNNT